MRIILQKVSSASVKVAGETVGAIGRGLLLLVGVERGDGPREVVVAADKLLGLRIFPDDEGKMNLDLSAVGGQLLVVSQFTLGASLAKGRRPSFNHSAPPAEAEPLVAALMERLAASAPRVEGGRFGAMMEVALVNDGPVTFVLDVRDGKVL